MNLSFYYGVDMIRVVIPNLIIFIFFVVVLCYEDSSWIDKFCVGKQCNTIRLWKKVLNTFQL